MLLTRKDRSTRQPVSRITARAILAAISGLVDTWLVALYNGQARGRNLAAGPKAA